MHTGLPEFRIDACVDGPITRVAVFGEVDAGTAPELAECLHELIGTGPDEVVVDLAGLEFIDSAGLSVLAGAHKQMRDAGTQLVVTSPPPPARRILDISGLAAVLTIR